MLHRFDHAGALLPKGYFDESDHSIEMDRCSEMNELVNVRGDSDEKAITYAGGSRR